MTAELRALEDNSTWTLEPLPLGKKPIGCKWVFKTKLKADGSVECYKAWLVARIHSGFHSSQADHSLFTLTTSTSIVLVLVYVDDILVAGNDLSQIEIFKKILSAHFKTKDLGSLKYFLGLEVARSPIGIFLNQRKYALDILSDSGQLGARTAPFPMEQHLKLTIQDGNPLLDPGLYRHLASRVPHMIAALRVLHYIKGCPGQGIFFPSSNNTHVSAYTDSDWANCPATRHSTTGYFIQLGTSLISWLTKKQSTVSRSSAEAEYRAMVVTTCELTWLKQLLTDLGVPHPEPFTLHCDN
ncbi:uncharacterized mitochondrial protein AtMg00810-like [Carya illinoinensis]|uniref:uncharacterized mitochondrial protein AtMg00810-like n=1 Tax=Carya illinoinensis TaxID=32201 RepID=UPI001C71FB98|nr:uncharacterized mitochondrial protein AtMg00810-like [Carya illinoinensis]